MGTKGEVVSHSGSLERLEQTVAVIDKELARGTVMPVKALQKLPLQGAQLRDACAAAWTDL